MIAMIIIAMIIVTMIVITMITIMMIIILTMINNDNNRNNRNAAYECEYCHRERHPSSDRCGHIPHSSAMDETELTTFHDQLGRHEHNCSLRSCNQS